MTSSADLINALQTEGAQVSLSFTRLTPTTGKLTWTLPETLKAYDGILIVSHVAEINPSNYPTNGVKYTASANLLTPADSIGNARVVAAIYGDKSTSSVDLTGLDSGSVYYFAGFAVSNVRSYHLPGIRSYGESLSDEIYAGDMHKSYGPPANPVVGAVYFDRDQKLVFVWDGSAWLPTSAHTVITGQFDPVSPFTGLPEDYPALGDFYFNTTQQMLKVWNGSAWLSAESTQGSPNYEKQGVGTTGRGSARVNMIDILKHQLGYPKVCVELTDRHFQIAIDNALQEIRRRTDSAYNKQYFFMKMHKNQGIYYLNDPSIGTDKIVDVLRIHRLNMLGLVNFAPDNIYAQQFLNQFFAPGVQYDLVSIHLIHSMSELFGQLFAGEVAYNWREASRQLFVHRNFATDEKVIVETSCEKLEEEILVDRWMQQWVQQWAEAELMMMLSHIRGKYATLPGPGGGLSLNAADLRSEGQRLQEDCVQQIADMLVGQQGPDGWYIPMAIG